MEQRGITGDDKWISSWNALEQLDCLEVTTIVLEAKKISFDSVLTKSENPRQPP